jgi:hypothetical protein
MEMFRMNWSTRVRVLFTFSLLSMPAAHATVVYSPTGVTVTALYGYSEFGGGDVAFTVSAPPSGCDGLWLRPTDAGFKTLYAMLLTAYTTKAPMQVGAIDDSLWSGTTSRFCRVYGLYPAS